MSPESKGVSMPVAIGTVLIALVVVIGAGLYLGNSIFWKADETRNLQDIKFDNVKAQYLKNPKSPDFKIAYALVLHAQKKDSEAKKLFEELAKDFPKSNEVQVNYGTFLKDTGNFAEAEKVFKKIVDRAPYFLNANVQYGVLLREQGKYKESLDKFDKALKLEPAAADIILEKAKVYAAMKDKAKARELANQALTFYPSYEDAKKLLKELE